MISLSGDLLSKYHPSSDYALKINEVLPRLAKKDSSIWGPEAESEAKVRLNWIDLPKNSEKLLPQIDEIKKWVSNQNFEHIVLCGMGGSSLAPEVFSKTFSKTLTILDSTHPEQIAPILKQELKKTLFIFGSKSGTTIETLSQKLLFEHELAKLDLAPKDHFLVITDPSSALAKDAQNNNYKVVLADPFVGGRFSALSAFGLIPAALMGVDIKEILLQAQRAANEFAHANSVATKIAVLILEQTEQFLAFCDEGSNVPGLSDWIEQLIAESTGKDFKGRLPVVLENLGSEISGDLPLITFTNGAGNLSVVGELGEQFILWEWVVALVCYGLGVDPFNQPNVTEAKDRTASLLLSQITEVDANLAFEDANIKVFANRKFFSLDEALAYFLAPKNGYIALMAYLNRNDDFEITKLRNLIADKTSTPTTFGWGPRFLHSTGQFHKGGQQNGAFIQITGDSALDLEIPSKNYSFNKLLLAQAQGDFDALKSRSLPIIRFHLKERVDGINTLVEALKRI